MPCYKQSEGANSSLAAGSAYSTTVQVTLPLSDDLVSGTYFFILVTDSTQSLAEATTGSNAASSAINIGLPPLPALAVSGLSASTHQVYPGQSLNLSWTVTNNGAATASGPWNDEVFLASDSQGDNEILLGTFPDGNSLVPGASYTSNEQISLPAQATGQGWLVVTADPDSAVLEPGTAANRTEIDSVPLVFGSYTVSAQTTAQTVNVGTPVAFTGTAVDSVTGDPVADAPVAV